LMRQAIQRRFGVTPSGLWLTERVWEPELPRTLAQCGIRYTILDTNQFRIAQGVLPGRLHIQDEQGWDLLGCYVTEYAGSSVVLFPGSKRLRYWMPFQEVSRTIEFLKRLVQKGPIAITFADDGEKFGFWPTTHRWVYEQGWLEQFFSALERESSWLKTETCSRYLVQAGPSGRVYLPCGSYEEMLEWSGGYFRNFFVKYPEANAMHQKMLSVSHRLRELKAHLVPSTALGARQGSRLKAKHNKPRASPARRSDLKPGRASLQPPTKQREERLRQAERELYMAQGNDAYWHGVFGGLYLAHLRRAVYRHLMTAEQLLQQASGRLPAREFLDLDGDGHREGLLRSRSLSVVVDPAENGTVTELDCYSKAINLVDTLARRYEPYHEKLGGKRLAPVARGGQAPTSIHELLGVKEEGLEAILAYDDHRRSCFIDYALSAMPTLQDVRRSMWGEHRLWSGGPWDLQEGRGRSASSDRATVTLSRHVQDGGCLRKAITLFRDHPRLAFRYQLVDLDVPIVGLEFNLCLRDDRWSEPRWQESVRKFQVRDPSVGLSVTMAIDLPASLVTFPIETVSESEEGLERTYQGLAIVCLWSTSRNHRWSCGLEWVVEDL